MLSEAKHLYRRKRDPSLPLRVTFCKVICVTKNSNVVSIRLRLLDHRRLLNILLISQRFFIRRGQILRQQIDTAYQAVETFHIFYFFMNNQDGFDAVVHDAGHRFFI